MPPIHSPPLLPYQILVSNPSFASLPLHFYKILLTCRYFTAYLLPMPKEAIGTDLVFKAMADPSRRKVLDLLCKENGQTLSQLCAQLDMQRQSATQHIEMLIDANLVSVVWKGREKLHFLNPVPIYEVYARWVRKFEENRLGFLHDLKAQLEGDNNGTT